MKSSLKKLRHFTFSNHGPKVECLSTDPNSAKELKEQSAVIQQAIEDMREQYDGLLGVAQAISGSAYDFSRSIQDMASYMLETFNKTGDEDSGNVLTMLGKVQFEISKLLDLYAAHVSKTIIKPTECLLKELQSVQDLKRQYDEKRQLYDQIRTQKSKGRFKKESSDPRLPALKEELNDQAMVLGLRFQSVKLGHELSLVTQAAHHHTAQVHMFGRSLESLNAVEPLVKQLTLDHNIDRMLNEMDVKLVDGSDLEMEVELDHGDEEAQVQPLLFGNTAHIPTQPHGGIAKSAPMFRTMYSSSKQEFMKGPVQPSLTTYALPTPDDATDKWPSQPATSIRSKVYSTDGLEALSMSGGMKHNMRSPHEAKGRMEHGISAHTCKFSPKLDISSGDKNENHEGMHNFHVITSKSSGHAPNLGYSEVHDSPLPRYCYSGPLTGNQNHHGTKGPTATQHSPSHEVIDPLYKSGPLGRSSVPWAFSSPKVSHCTSPMYVSPPHISELHKLPMPPTKPAALVAHSAPLGFQPSPKLIQKSVPASPLPLPALTTIKKSRSIPSSIDLGRNLHGSESPVSFGNSEVESPLFIRQHDY